MNLIMLTDSYKFSHYKQFPNNSQYTHYYFECRSDKEFDEVYFFGLSYYLQEYLSKGITREDIDQAYEWAKQHGVPFPKEEWESLLSKHEGKLPLVIHAVEEGKTYPCKQVLFTVENTDPDFPWLPGWFETLLVKVWYPITVASKANFIKKMMIPYWEDTSDNPEGVNFAYHNFGDRGSSSVESAMIGGMAHLQCFSGTDNFNSVPYLYKYYKTLRGNSIPASEHSTVTSWGEVDEYLFYKNYLEAYKNSPMIACVLDSYNIYDAVDFVTSGDMKSKIELEEYPTFVMRPDSGDHVKVVNQILNITEKNDVKYTTNSKGYKIWNKYRVIWGDGVNPATIELILKTFVNRGYSVENIAFGSGGDLMQKLDRDTLGCAYKCSSITIKGNRRDVFKNPVDSPNKASKKGVLALVRWRDNKWHDKRYGDIQTINRETVEDKYHEVLTKEVFRDGEIINE